MKILRISHQLSRRLDTHEKRFNLFKAANVEQIVPRLRSILSSAEFQELDTRKQLAVRTFLDTFDGKIKDVF